MTDYTDILNRSWDEVPEVKLLPQGSWLLRGRNASFQAPKSDDKSPQVLFVYQAKEPMEDVDGSELAELGAEYEFSENRIFARFYVESGADWDNVRKHLAKHGIDSKDYATINESLKAFKGTEVIGYLQQRSYTNGANQTVTENTVSNFAAAE